MVKIIQLFISDKVTVFKRRLFWLYKLSISDLGKSMSIEFPVIREGAGNLTIGDYGYLGKLSNIGIAKDSKLIAKNNFHMGRRSTILLSNQTCLNIGSHFKLGEGSRLFVNANWNFGDDVKIETNCSIFTREPHGSGKLIIGQGSHIGDFTIIDLVEDVLIGREVAIGPNCILYTHDHVYIDKLKPAWKGGIVSNPIIIEDGAWIGSGVTILPGVTIGKRAVVAAGSVVTKNIDAETIWGGIPAKLIKTIE